MVSIELADAPYFELPFLNAAPGRAGGARRERLPFLTGRVSGLPKGCPPLVVTSDLQGRSDYGPGPETLLGCAVAAKLGFAHAAAALPSPENCVGLLAGDFYGVPDAARRGGIGDVTEVWSRMRTRLSSVVGVLGNHDLFGDRDNPLAPPVDCLDGGVINVAGLKLGGVSGIVGDTRRPNRKEVDAFVEALLNVLVEEPDILVLHVPPQADSGAAGEAAIAETLKSLDFAGLVICGHVTWPQRVQRCGKATCLNVDGAVVTLLPDE